MTDFDKWEAGREMDALVAERVMGLVPCDGWKPINFGSAGGPALMKECEHADNACYPTQSIGGISKGYHGRPPYSTDISAAWEVVESVAHSSFGLDRFINFDEDARFFANFAGEGVDVGASAPTAPLAICRAALKFVSQAREAAA